MGFNAKILADSLHPSHDRRCARVSYLTHFGKRDVQADLDLHDKLASSGHWSPFEHAAEPSPCGHPIPLSNFGSRWFQYRKKFQEEYCTKAPRDNGASSNA